MARSALAGVAAVFVFFFLVLLLFGGGATAALAQQQQQQQQNQSSALRQAGVCSRCHVAQVLEWSVAAKHGRAGTVCQSCHGPSAGHVANERNQVKPDRLPVGDQAIGALCGSCHAQGCPKTAKTAGCQSCHHPHALSDPNDKRLQPATAPGGNPGGGASAAAAAEYKASVAEGEQLVARRDWQAARRAFESALRSRPGDRRATARLRMVERRINPAMPGLEAIGDEFDGESGLPLRVRVTGLGLEMLLVRGGESDIGSEAWRDARPVHSVRVEPFYLGKFEVTQQEWGALGLEDPSGVKGERIPVHGISWRETRAWIAKLNARAAGGGGGGLFRLPSEAEWERAATMGLDGDATAAALGDRAWFRLNAAVMAASGGGFREAGDYAPRAVGLKRPNGAGFFDMQGNVAEWCSSLVRPYPYDARDGRESGDESQEGLRAVRGGAYADSAEYLDPAFRHGERPGRRNRWTGLRLAR